MAAPRQTPAARTAGRMRPTVPYDSQGMDPEMVSTLGAERNRVMQNKMMFSPSSATPGTEVKPPPQPNALQRVIDFITRKNLHQPAPAAPPTTTPTQRAMSQAEEDSISKKYLGE